MFGYIRAEKGELKVKEYDTYKAIYCSLCKKLGKNYGILSRMTLSYDFTFLALLNMSLESKCPEFERKRCAFNPLKKCNYCKDTDTFEMPAAAAMIMLYYKIIDNIEDEKGLKKLGFVLLKPIFKSANKKAAKRFPEIKEIVSEYMSQQKYVEQKEGASLDEACDPTAKALSKIFELCSEDTQQKRVLNRLGYCMGRYIYLLDAAVDVLDDVKKGNFNPLKVNGKHTTKEDVVKRVEPQLYFCINECIMAFELLNVRKYKTILGNIIYLGLEETFKKELKK